MAASRSGAGLGFGLGSDSKPKPQSNSSSSGSRNNGEGEGERLRIQAELAEKACRYKEMCVVMRRLSELKSGPLNTNERNLLGVAYKNVLSATRVSWRILTAHEIGLRNTLDNMDAKAKDYKQIENELKQCRDYRAMIEKEISQKCEEILQCLSKHILPKTDSNISKLDPNVLSLAHSSYTDVKSLEDAMNSYLSGSEASGYILQTLNAASIVFYYKMRGDIHRYLVETASDYREDSQDANMALGFYAVATRVAKAHLSPGDPIRLGLALNKSVFYHAMMSAPGRACEIAKNAFDEAVMEMPKRPSSQYSDSTLIMSVLRDNLTTWTRAGTDAEHPSANDPLRNERRRLRAHEDVGGDAKT